MTSSENQIASKSANFLQYLPSDPSSSHPSFWLDLASNTISFRRHYWLYYQQNIFIQLVPQLKTGLFWLMIPLPHIHTQNYLPIYCRSCELTLFLFKNNNIFLILNLKTWYKSQKKLFSISRSKHVAILHFIWLTLLAYSTLQLLTFIIHSVL